jgi:hypothetical protein
LEALPVPLTARHPAPVRPQELWPAEFEAFPVPLAVMHVSVPRHSVPFASPVALTLAVDPQLSSSTATSTFPQSSAIPASTTASRDAESRTSRPICRAQRISRASDGPGGG